MTHIESHGIDKSEPKRTERAAQKKYYKQNMCENKRVMKCKIQIFTFIFFAILSVKNIFLFEYIFPYESIFLCL